MKGCSSTRFSEKQESGSKTAREEAGVGEGEGEGEKWREEMMRELSKRVMR